MDKHEQYWKLSEMEARYNASSGGVRTLASAWILAALGAMGWLLAAHEAQAWPLPLGFLLVVVTTLGVIGIITLWVMDQLVFHRLLSSVFLVGLKIEADNPDIPPLRSMMLKRQEGLGTHRWEALFYLGPAIVFAMISAVVLVGGWDSLFSPAGRGFSMDTRVLGVLLAVVQLAALAWMVAKLPAVAIRDSAAYFQDPAFSELFPDPAARRKARFETVVASFRSKPPEDIAHDDAGRSA